MERQRDGWCVSPYQSNYLSLLMDKMFDEKDQVRNDHHTEEGKNRRRLNANDSEKLRQEMANYTNPPTSNADRVVNVVNGCVASDKVNVADAV